MRINSFSPFHKGPGGPVQYAGAALCGVSLGIPATLAGRELGEHYGPRVVEYGIRKAVPLMRAGWISPHTLLTWAPKALDPLIQAQTGAVVVGCLGVAAGVMLGAALFE